MTLGMKMTPLFSLHVILSSLLILLQTAQSAEAPYTINDVTSDSGGDANVITVIDITPELARSKREGRPGPDPGPDGWLSSVFSFVSSKKSDNLRNHRNDVTATEVSRSQRGRPVPLKGRPPVNHKYNPAVQPAVQPDSVSGLTKLFGSVLPNTYYSRPKYRYPYYEQSGKGYLLYGYGDQELYEYSVFKPLEGYF